MPPLVLVAVAWMVGLVVAHHWLVPAGHGPLPVLLLGIIPLAAPLLWSTNRSVRVAASCALVFLLGAAWYSFRLTDLGEPGYVAYYNEIDSITVEGGVTGYPQVGEKGTKLKADAERILIEGEWLPVRGKVLIHESRSPEFHYGDRLRLTGKLQTPPVFERFSYREYLAQHGIHSLMWRPRAEMIGEDQGSPFWQALYSVRTRASDVIARLVPEPEASLMQGIVLGIEAGIPGDLIRRLQ